MARKLLSTLDTALRQVCISTLHFYKAHIDDRKGFKCAYAAFHGGESCSTLILRKFEEETFWSAVKSTRQQLIQCDLAAHACRRDDRFIRRNGRAYLLVGVSLVALSGCGPDKIVCPDGRPATGSPPRCELP